MVAKENLLSAQWQNTKLEHPEEKRLRFLVLCIFNEIIWFLLQSYSHFDMLLCLLVLLLYCRSSMKYLGFFYNLTKPITWFLLQPDGRNLSFDLVWIVSVQYKDINSAELFSFVITINRQTYSTSKQTYLLYITYHYSSLFKNQITSCMEYIPIELRNILCYFWPKK